jgi:pantetheine-phosphate adenylyltransferase
MILIKTFESCACGRRTLGRLGGLRGFIEKEKISEGSGRCGMDAVNGPKPNCPPGRPAPRFFTGRGSKFWVRIDRRMEPEAGNGVTAVYPGSFDPVTNGHLDLIARGAKIFGRLIVAVAQNLDKDPLFGVEERVEMLEAVTFEFRNVEVDIFGGLLMDYARAKGARVVLRGIRAVSDYEYELQMAMMNRKIEPEIETVFMMPGEAYSYVSSRLVKELARLGGSVKGLVPKLVEERLRGKVS